MKKNKITNEVRWWIIISEVDVIWGRVYSIVDKLKDIFIKGECTLWKRIDVST